MPTSMPRSSASGSRATSWSSPHGPSPSARKSSTTWAQDLEQREQTLQQRVTELEREQSALVERHTEIVAEYARVQELAGHAEGRVDELEHAERDRAEAAAELAKQLAQVGERERELKRERASFEARQQEAEARLSSRESAVRERDGRPLSVTVTHGSSKRLSRRSVPASKRVSGR